uniref:Transcription inhibitor protein Gfh1 n=1 Tax=Thermus aquaticus TaxID=271 RepID=GFH1_THEAQ|nr:RecName: Full=Transcription inhibitor protein Gfh1; AltName: Full=Anti-cleavage anti-GreA transcription factor; AltName: Full=Gre factor homolog 1 [Thermus aquaticus]AAL57610.1 anti-cleavage anti-GreA transcription factor Gfh1 [Thermus aquaticus]2ETN_A Chain A, anti-cleavage anti-GreA transcription factor Gfh1 [Thermus aquaticus]2ETN_B Chain B, anti-cleavage anti-GreA transcription factor Gfh1 [Thermus aquaticus]2ETN_C Chain C, anti-cleavage anti-GreA transcription factor Gfh1 [Thermus aquat
MAREVKLTKAGYERLMKQLEQERERLQEATKILQELMESSDDYDDSGLEAAKQEKARIEARIDSLEDVLSRAVILEEGTGEVIGLGSVVELEDPATGERLSVQVVSPAEASVLENPMKISDASPMGKALLGHRVGDVLSLDTPKGKKEFRVVAIHGR